MTYSEQSISDYIALSTRIAELEIKVNKLEDRSGLMSRSWFTRVYTAWGYVIIGQLLIALVVLAIGMFFGLLGS